MALASSMAIITCFAISFSNTSSLPLTKPPVSITLNCLPAQSATPYCLSLVTPLTSSTMALRCSSKRLKNVLLPTFGLPVIATVKLIPLSPKGELNFNVYNFFNQYKIIQLEK